MLRRCPSNRMLKEFEFAVTPNEELIDLSCERVRSET